MTTAQSKEDFISKWMHFINELYKIGKTLPDEEVEPFLELIETLEEYVHIAANYHYE